MNKEFYQIKLKQLEELVEDTKVVIKNENYYKDMSTLINLKDRFKDLIIECKDELDSNIGTYKLNKEIYNFLKECEDIKNAIGGCIRVARNKVTGYGCNGIFQIIEVDNGFKLIKKVDGMIDKQDFNFEDIIFNEYTIKKIEFGEKFGKYANLYLDEYNYIHVHICLSN